MNQSALAIPGDRLSGRFYKYFFAARGYTSSNPEVGSYDAPAAGTYYLKVVAYAGATSSYSLLVTGAGVQP